MQIYVYHPDTFKLTHRGEVSLGERLDARRPDDRFWFVRPMNNPPRPFGKSDVRAILAWMNRESAPGLVLDGHPEIGDDDVEDIRSLRPLMLLSLRKTTVTEQGLRSLSRLKALKYLDIADTGINPETLAAWLHKTGVVTLPGDWSIEWNRPPDSEPAAPTSFWLGPKPGDIPGRLKRGQFPADYTLKLRGLDGKSVTLLSQRGKVIFLNFWATYCGPCRSELPSLEALYLTLKDQPVFFAYITPEPVSVVKGFLEKNPLQLPIYSADMATAGPYGSQGIPATYIISKKGDWVVRRLGAAQWDSQDVIDFLFQLMKE